MEKKLICWIVVEKLKYKLFLTIVKHLPFVIALFYFLFTVASCMHIRLVILPTLFYMSPISILFMLSASFVFQFCIWQRLPLYYCLLLQVIHTIDYYIPITFSDGVLFSISSIITVCFILIGMYLKNKANRKIEFKD